MKQNHDIPTEEEWPSPTLTFDEPADRRIFQQTLIDKRDFYLRSADELPDDVADVGEGHLSVLNSMIDKLGKQQGDSEPYTLETPAEVNVALSAVNFVYDAIREEGGDNQKALDNLASLAAALSRAHWKNDPFENFINAEEVV